MVKQTGNLQFESLDSLILKMEMEPSSLTRVAESRPLRKPDTYMQPQHVVSFLTDAAFFVIGERGLLHNLLFP